MTSPRVSTPVEVERGERGEQERDGEHDAEVEEVDEPVERVAGAVVADAGARADAAAHALLAQRRGDELEVGEVVPVEPVAHERDRRSASRPIEQAEHGDAEGEPEVAAELGDVAFGEPGQRRARAGSACP